MPEMTLTIRCKKGWILRTGRGGLFIAAVLMEFGATLDWFMNIDVV